MRRPTALPRAHLSIIIANFFLLASACSSNDNSGNTSTGGSVQGTGGNVNTGGASGSSDTDAGTGGAAPGTGGASGAAGAGGVGGTDTDASSESSAGGSTGAGGTGDASMGDDAGSGIADAGRDVRFTDAGAYDRTGWTAVSMPPPAAVPNPPLNPPEQNLVPANAFDGRTNTRWATGIFQQNLTFPLTFTVDMKQPVTFSRITLYAGDEDTNDYPMSMDIQVSQDGTTFATLQAGHQPMPPVNGTNRAIDTIVLPTAPTAQFIRLVATQPRTNATVWWAIGEMNVFP